MTLRCFSYGGGVQSTAALVLAAQGKIDYKIFLFSNVGDDSEHPDTLRYVEEVAKPYAIAHGIELHELRYTNKDGRVRTIYQTLTDAEKPAVIIPARFATSGMPIQRACTNDYKTRRIAAWMQRHGATRKHPGVCGLGISIDEFQRMRTDSGFKTHTLEYPLIDLRLTRQDCANIIQKANLSIPPKSACWFCPFHRTADWLHMRRTNPALFERAVALEKTLGDTMERQGKDRVFLSRLTIPLEQAAGKQAYMFDEDDACESGFCMT